ncbi:hypothetical protein Agub_g6622 [Astrephomene gubernaculifera]|uniref:RING-type domain-containing protein n=1 Tax=Astrephomene gubernaculifera TaxID=47775 RepID=A0AAD3DNN1_9CHLO|nr:hypothetical protein Agub_g6622 [Astrephomene gubernaculifera]
MKRDKDKDRQKDRHALLAAAALQDHLARRLRMPGGPVVQPSLQPGAPLTLAQHLGLIPRPPPLLTEEEWTEVHLKSRLRQDSAHECVICREEFQAGAQVLLSCSHTFHRHCLAAFERYSRCKTCPLCRAQQYQKRVIRDGEELYRHRCATRIQAAWRGHAARRRYRQLRRHRPPRDEQLRKKWAAERLQEDTDRLLSAMEEEVGDLDDLFAELDASVAASRQLCDQALLRPLAARLQQREAEEREAAEGRGRGRRRGSGGGEEEEEEEREERGGVRTPLLDSSLAAPSLSSTPSALAATRVAAATASSRQQHSRQVGDDGGSASSDDDEDDESGNAGGGGGGGGGRGAGAGGGGRGDGDNRTVAAALAAAGAAGRPATAADVDWAGVVAKAKSRGSLECPICLGHISRRGNEGIAWLSCTHCFHVDCIMAFEAFELASGGTPTCPVCRSGYRRRCFA